MIPARWIRVWSNKMIDLNCFSDGYLKHYNRRGEKIYCAITRFHGRPRLSIKIHHRATDAVMYGDRLVKRYLRLKESSLAGSGSDIAARDPLPAEGISDG